MVPRRFQGQVRLKWTDRIPEKEPIKNIKAGQLVYWVEYDRDNSWYEYLNYKVKSGIAIEPSKENSSYVLVMYCGSIKRTMVLANKLFLTEDEALEALRLAKKNA